MPRPRTTLRTATPEAAIRTGLGLSQRQLADWLGVSAGFVAACETGRKALPPALAERLLALARLLPPPLGSGPPGPPPLPAAPVLPALAWAAPATPDPLGPPPTPEALHPAARAARLAALLAEQALLRLHARALDLAQRRQGLARLHAAPPPPEAAEAARWAAWLATLAQDLALADPHPAQAAARRHQLAIRAATRYAEANALTARPGGAA